MHIDSTLLAAALALTTGAALAQPSASAATGPLPSLDVAAYMGTWHQVMHLPNRFQRACVADTTATYALRADGDIDVTNRCRTADGEDRVVGQARPRGGARIVDGRLSPASLQVSFAPRWTRWVPLVWGDYDVVALLDGARVSIVTEPSREYLWVLARDKALTPAQRQQVDALLTQLGFDLTKVKAD